VPFSAGGRSVHLAQRALLYPGEDGLASVRRDKEP
jgi:hypothetical protein